MTQVVRFKAENARCVFLEGAGVRLELIEVLTVSPTGTAHPLHVARAAGQKLESYVG